MVATDQAAAPRVVSGEPERQRSSCEIKTSTRGTDIGIKVYEGSPIQPACDEAIKAYFYTFDRVEDQLMARRRTA